MHNNVEDKLEGVPVPIGCVVANMGSVARLGLTVDLVARAIVAVMMPLAKVKNLTMMNTRIMMVTTNERMI